MLIELKIGRKTYEINENDVFMDNGIVVLLLTQSSWTAFGYAIHPQLSKRAIKEISIFNRIQKPRCRFSLTKGE